MKQTSRRLIAIYPVKYTKGSMIKKLLVKSFNGMSWGFRALFDMFNFSNYFSPTRLFMKGWITVDEYKNISKYNIVKLRLYHTPSAPIFFRVAFRMVTKTILIIFRKILLN